MPVLETVKWTPDRRLLFKKWFHSELRNTQGDRATKETAWQDAIKQWRARMPEGVKEFPWEGASNLIFPITAMHADPVYADMMQTFHAAEFWNVIANRPDRVGSANSMREALKAIDRDFLKMRTVNRRNFLWNTVLGTAIYKTHYKYEARHTRGYNEAGEIANVVKTISQPKIDWVPLNDFYIPADAWDIDPDAPVGGARWVAQQFRMTLGQLNQKAEERNLLVEPAWDKSAVKEVSAFIEELGTRETSEGKIENTIREEDDQFKPFRDPKVTLYECHARFDVNGDGIDEDIVVIWHQPTMTILRALYQPFLHGKRPFHDINYLPTFSFYGMGIAETSEWAQTTLTKLLNGTVDNVMLVNTRMYSAPLGSNIEPGEPIYPGKIWMVGPNEKVSEVRMGDINPSLPLTMQSLMQWAELRDSVPEIRSGDMSSLPSRTPAQTTESILREGKRKFDEIFASMRVPLGTMGLRVIQLVAQYAREDPQHWINYFTNTLGQDDAAKVMDVLQSPIDTIGDSYGVTPMATSAQSNRFAERQELVGLLQILSQIYPQLVQTALLIEQVPPGSVAADTALAAYQGGVEMISRLLERFDIQNPEQYVPNPPQIQQMVAQRAQQMGQPVPEVQFGQLGGFFGAAPFTAGGQRPLANILGQG